MPIFLGVSVCSLTLDIIIPHCIALAYVNIKTEHMQLFAEKLSTLFAHLCVCLLLFNGMSFVSVALIHTIATPTPTYRTWIITVKCKRCVHKPPVHSFYAYLYTMHLCIFINRCECVYW